MSLSNLHCIAIVTVDNPPVNAGSQAVRKGLMEALSTTEADASTRAVVLTGAGRTFLPGADMRQFGKSSVELHLSMS